MAIAEFHVRVGKLLSVKRRPIVCAAPSNTATDSMLQVLLTKMRGNVDMNLVRFRGSDLPHYISRTEQ